MKKLSNNIILDLLVILSTVGLICITTSLVFGKKINENVQIINQIAIKVDKNSQLEETVYVKEEKLIKNYPEYGSQYANIKIPSIDVDLPVYFGDGLDLLKDGVGHSTGSYFPGEGGSIVYLGHNYKSIFRRFSELEIGNDIKITTNYGEFNYKIYDMQLIYETELEKLPIQKDEEILMIYTCYPFNNIGYTTQRYVVYAKPVN